jgi:hypothetical protein
VRIPLTQTQEVETLAASSPILFLNYDYQVVLESVCIVKSQRNMFHKETQSKTLKCQATSTNSDRRTIKGKFHNRVHYCIGAMGRI